MRVWDLEFIDTLQDAVNNAEYERKIGRASTPELGLQKLPQTRPLLPGSTIP